MSYGKNVYQNPAQSIFKSTLLGMSFMVLLISILVFIFPAQAAIKNIKLNGHLVSGGDVEGFQISPDNSHVVYRATQDTNNVFELYSVPIAGGTVTKLNSPLVPGGEVSSFQISPDSSRVVYLADQDTDNVLELYSVPIGGGSVTKLNSPLVPGGNTGIFQISPDSSRVVYTADQDTDGVFELYSVPIGGGSVTKLNSPLVPGGYGIWGFQISPNSSRVVYRADQDTDNVFELYSVPIAGGTVTKLNSPLVPGSHGILGFKISPDSSNVVYRADQDTYFVVELYSVPIAGGTVTKLNSELVPGGDVSDHFQISSDSSRVVYQAYQDTYNALELYSVPIVGGKVTKLNSKLVPGGTVLYGNFQISPDSSRVVYVADQDTDNVFELYVSTYVSPYVPYHDEFMPLPTGPVTINYFYVFDPVKSSTPSMARPLGLGNGYLLSWTITAHVAFSQFAAPVDVYIAVQIPGFTEIQLFTPTNTLVPLNMASPVAWKIATSGPINEVIFTSTRFAVPLGQYTVYIVVVPAGTNPATFNFATSPYYMWTFTVMN